MASKALSRHSLKTRITLSTLAIFLFGLWSLSFYASQVLRTDMERLLTEHQFSTVSLIAAEVDHELTARLKALESVAESSSEVMHQGPAAMQHLIDHLPVLQTLFNGGVVVYNWQGAQVADFPRATHPTNAGDPHGEVVAAAIKNGQALIGRPVRNRDGRDPMFGMAAPIRDGRGHVIGALAGVITLGLPNFLDGLTQSRYGQSGYYLLEEPRQRLVITGTDKRRVMQPLPAPGVNALIDRHVQGFDETGVTVNPLGVEVLASARRIPSAGWFLVGALPTAEAFAPIRSMQQRMLLATLLLTVLAAALTWWMLRRQLAPLLSAARTLANLADSSQPPQPLAIRRPDEIGQLIGGFNRLLADLGQREALLQQILDTSSVAIFLVDNDGRITRANQRMAEMFGYPLAQLLGSEYIALIHPSEREIGREKMLTLLASQTPSVDLDRRYWRADQSEFWGHLTGKRFFDAAGEERGLVGVIADITARKQAKEALEASEQRFRDMVNTTDGIVWEADATTFTYTFVSQQAERLLGFPVSDWQQPGFWVAHLHPQDRLWAPQFCANHTALLQSHDYEYRFMNRDGQAVWLRDIVTVVAEDGQARWLRGLTVDISKSKQMEAVLRANEARYQALTQSAHDAIVTADSDGRITQWSRGAEALFGYAASEAIGLPLSRLIPARHRDAHHRGFNAWQSGGNARFGGRTLEVEGLHKDGHEFPAELSLAGWETDAGHFVTGVMRDISARKQTEADLRVAATAFESQEAMAITDAHKVILKVNQAFTRITGYSAEEAIGQTPALLSSGRQDSAFYQAMWISISQKNYWQGEIWNRRKNGEIYPERLAISAVLDDSGQVTHYVAAFADITQNKRAQDEIQQLAFTDPLTGLPNRRLLLDRLKQSLAANSRSKRQGALLFIDLDNFKTLNDTLGHDIGDLLLQQVTQRLIGCVREGDTVARLGGDEFVVMLEALSVNPTEAALQAEVVGEKILAALNQIYLLAGYEHHSSASIGLTLFGDKHETVDELLKRADLAMYSSKTAGRNTLRLFRPEMQTVVTARATLEADLREAVQKDQFLLYYQAQVTGDHHMVGAEVLVRWQHPQRGLVSPAEFIPVAEETGLILPLGQWVLMTACKQLAAWAQHAETAQLTLAVNVSARQFHHRDFVKQVLHALDQTGANPQRLKLELTESMLVVNVGEIIAKMSALKERGVSFSLDDFGTGYSSLAYLKRLPLDQLKIDQGFVRDILIDPNDAAIAKMVVALAESLGLAVIAEGVETEAQRAFLAGQGCHAYQGYLFSRPLPLGRFEAFLYQRIDPALAATDAAGGN